MGRSRSYVIRGGLNRDTAQIPKDRKFYRIGAAEPVSASPRIHAFGLTARGIRRS
jgi:hypothetical protein